MCKKEIEQYEDNLRNLCFPVEFRREFAFVPSFQERYPLETLSRSKTNNFFLFFYVEGLFNREEKCVVSNENNKKAIGIY